MNKYKYYWGRFKSEIHIHELTIIRVEQNSDCELNCDIMACDDIFSENEFEFIEEIKHINEST